MDKGNVNYMEESLASEEEEEVCVAEWVDTPGNKPISCSFLKYGAGKKDEMKCTFDVSKCEKLFELLLKGWLIRLTEGHVIPSADQLAKKKYCKCHDSYSHMTNECNYFH
jgi:hypothetical protein